MEFMSLTASEGSGRVSKLGVCRDQMTFVAVELISQLHREKLLLALTFSEFLERFRSASQEKPNSTGAAWLVRHSCRTRCMG